MKGKIVLKITDDIDPSEVLCTTYQMRNFYRQFGDGFVNSLDIMNFMQHDKASMLARSGDRVLDMCCGRGLMLPLLKWNRPKIHSWTGVDIAPANFGEATRYFGIRKIDPVKEKLAVNWMGSGKPVYPFEVNYVEANVAEMTPVLGVRGLLDAGGFDYVIYTASIEHMQREAGVLSLKECYRVMKKGARCFLSSPNTSDKADPYDTQYAAHLYEWPRTELLQVCREVGFKVKAEYGLVAKVTGYRNRLRKEYPELLEVFDQFAEYMPSAWLYATFPVITPRIADEVAFLLVK